MSTAAGRRSCSGLRTEGRKGGTTELALRYDSEQLPRDALLLPLWARLVDVW